MKSPYYLATVINAYRNFMDGGDEKIAEEELLKVAHRDYTEAYADGKNNQTVNYTDSQSKGEFIYIADVLGAKDGFVEAKMRNRFKVGDMLEVLSPSSAFRKSFVVEEVYNSKGEKTDDCKLVGEHYRIKCPLQLSSGDFLRRKNER